MSQVGQISTKDEPIAAALFAVREGWSRLLDVILFVLGPTPAGPETRHVDFAASVNAAASCGSSGDLR